MQTERRLYNVNNRHQCLREPLRHLYIVQPFPQYAPHFYGCTICGQYHLCHLHELSCVVVSDPVSQRMTCLYSGQLLRQSEALVPNIYDDAHDDAPLYAGAATTVSRGIYSGGGGSGKACYTNMAGPRSTYVGRAVKRQARSASVAHRQQQQLGTAISKTIYGETVVPDSLVIATNAATTTTTTTPEADNDETTELAIEMGAEHHDADEEDGGDDGMLSLYETNANSAKNVTYHSNYNYWNTLFAYLIESSPPIVPNAPKVTTATSGGSDEENKLFLDKEVDDESTPLPQQAPHHSRGALSKNNSESGTAAGSNNTQISIATTDTGLTKESETFKLSVLGDGVATELEECTSAIVKHLMVLQLKEQGVKLTGMGQSRLHANLSSHFSRLVCNMAVLIYNSPILRTIYNDRQSRAQRHRGSTRRPGGSGSHDHASEYVPHLAILPGELCATLMLDLLAQSYHDQDAMGYAVDLWRANPWLRQLRDTGISERLMTSDRKLLRKQQTAGGGGPTSTILFEKERLVKHAIDVKECFAHYKGHAFWVRNFILNYRVMPPTPELHDNDDDASP
jgi:hypothetical protein